MKALLLIFLLPCALLAADEEAGHSKLQQRLIEAAESKQSVAFGRGEMKRVIFFRTYEEGMDGKQFEPMLIHVSDGIHEDFERPEISLRQLRKNVKMYCAAVEAAQEKPFFALSVTKEAERELVERVIKVVFDPGSAAMILIVPGNPTYSARKPGVIEPPVPIIPAILFQGYDPREVGPDLNFDEQSMKHGPSCLVHDCEVCKRASAEPSRSPVPGGR